MQNYKNHTKTANIFHYILENAQLWLRRSYYHSENRTKTRFCLVFRSLNRNSGFAEVTPFGKTQINLVFRSLNRNFAGDFK